MYKSNKKEPLWFFTKVVAQAGIEPATHGFSGKDWRPSKTLFDPCFCWVKSPSSQRTQHIKHFNCFQGFSVDTGMKSGSKPVVGR